MGKGLNGKELGCGISQKKNGKYLARKRIGGGQRISKEFDSLSGAKAFLAGSDVMTVDKWFIFWIENLLTSLRQNSRIDYTSRYNTWIKPVIGDMDITLVTPINCIEVLNNASSAGRKPSTVHKIKMVMHQMFLYAVDSKIIVSNPVTALVKVVSATPSYEEMRFLTTYEQKLFLDAVKGRRHENQYRFVLQTGLRYAELTGLKWSDVDIRARKLKVRRSAYFIEDHKEFVVGEPKTSNGYRDIYLTDEAIRVLCAEKKLRKEASSYDSEFIFLGLNGRPITRSIYNRQLKDICRKIGIDPLSMHKLRHTFATRCIESGMKPKTLQKILGHSDVTITLNYYVHITNDEMASEMRRLSASGF